ncbi:MAG: PAS domain S-box protein [Stellaceae bacterium]
MPPNDNVGERLIREKRQCSPGPVVAPAQTASPPALKILLLEDQPRDAELIRRELRETGLDFTARRADTREAFIGALETFAPDIVLADYKLTGFDGAAALAHVRRVHPEIPVVMVTGVLGDEGATALLKAGAKDFVLKDNLARLPLVIERALSEEQGVRARKAADAALRAANTLLETVERIAHIGGWDHDLVDDILVWSDEHYRIFGVSPGEFLPTLEHLIEFIHPDDRGCMRDAIDASLTRNRPFDIEFRILRLDQQGRIIRSRGEVARDENGKPIRLTGTSQDITEARRAEQTMREEEAKFRSLVEQNVAGIFIIRHDGTIGYVNPFFAALLGYAATDLIGHPLLDILPEEERDKAREKLEAQLAGGANFVEHNSTIKTKDGRTIEFLVNASRSIFEGRPASLAVVLDVTERTKAQRELAETAAILATEHEASLDGILVVDPQDRIISFNQQFIDMWGVSAELMASRSNERAMQSVLGKLRDPQYLITTVKYLFEHPEEKLHDELVLVDGRAFERYSAPMPRPEGGSFGRVFFFRDISERKETERTLLRLNRTLRTLSRGNEVLVHATSEPELLRETCQTIVETGGYRMAWIGIAQHDAAKSVIPAASAGDVGDYLDKTQVTWKDEPRGRGPTGRAIRSGEVQVIQNFAADPTVAPWRTEAKQHGFSSTIALPLKDESGVFGALTLYSEEVDAFDADEIKLLQELANDLAFGIRGVREHAAHEALNERWQASLEATVGAIANTVEMRDPYTAGHQLRVARLAVAIAREMGLPEQQIHGLYLAGIIHDVGKIDVPAEILSKPGKLSRLQFQLIQVHAQAGYDIVKRVDFPWPIAEMIRQHHERLDGSGYPQGLKSEVILPEAKILAVADAVEAMMSHRPYRAALGIDAALTEIDKGKGRLFDPAAVAACTALFRDDRFHFE